MELALNETAYLVAQGHRHLTSHYVGAAEHDVEAYARTEAPDTGGLGVAP